MSPISTGRVDDRPVCIAVACIDLKALSAAAKAAKQKEEEGDKIKAAKEKAADDMMGDLKKQVENSTRAPTKAPNVTDLLMDGSLEQKNK